MAKGNRLDELFTEKYYILFYSYVKARTKSDITFDILHDVYIKLKSGTASIPLDDDSEFIRYVKRCLIRTIYDWQKKNGSRTKVEEMAVLRGTLSPFCINQETFLMIKDELQFIENEASLTPLEKAILGCFYENIFSNREIAKTVLLDYQTVRKERFKLIRKFRKVIKGKTK